MRRVWRARAGSGRAFLRYLNAQPTVSRICGSCYRGFKAAMHIPDGFLSTPVWAALDVVSLPAVGWFARRARAADTESRAPLLGVLGAFVFAAQMINFPIAPGTSAHLLGGALLSCTLGPSAAVVVMTAVLAIQSLVFQDGGLRRGRRVGAAP